MSDNDPFHPHDQATPDPASPPHLPTEPPLRSAFFTPASRPDLAPENPYAPGNGSPLPPSEDVPTGMPVQAPPTGIPVQDRAGASPLSTPGADTPVPPSEPPTTPPTVPAESSPHPRRQRRGPSWIGVVAVALLTAVATLGASFLLWGPSNLDTLGDSGAKVATQPPVVQGNGEATDWETVAASVQPAVVAIQVASGQSGDTGSGVIFDEAGHVLTNYHVIASAVTGNAQITVELSDGQLARATVVGSDSTTDLAVLAIENPPSNLQMVALGSSSDLRQGQPVAAIGAPLGLQNTMTTGIISALDRPVVVEQSTSGDQKGGLSIPGYSQQNQSSEQVVTNAIQVDAAINPGNSGGPLFSADGTVIGITSSIASLSGSNGDSQSGSIGIGFAIPVNLAKSVADQILTKGYAEHAYLGVMISTNATQVDGKTLAGAAVSQVVAGEAAEKAGLQAGDVIVGIDDHTVSSGTALTGYVRWYTPGQQVTIHYVRDGHSQDATVTLGSTGNQH